MNFWSFLLFTRFFHFKSLCVYLAERLSCWEIFKNLSVYQKRKKLTRNVSVVSIIFVVSTCLGYLGRLAQTKFFNSDPNSRHSSNNLKSQRIQSVLTFSDSSGADYICLPPLRKSEFIFHGHTFLSQHPPQNSKTVNDTLLVENSPFSSYAYNQPENLPNPKYWYQVDVQKETDREIVIWHNNESPWKTPVFTFMEVRGLREECWSLKIGQNFEIFQVSSQFLRLPHNSLFHISTTFMKWTWTWPSAKPGTNS